MLQRWDVKDYMWPWLLKIPIAKQQANVSIGNCVCNMTAPLTTLFLDFLFTLFWLSHPRYFVPDILCFHCSETDIGFCPVLLSYNSCICLSWMKALLAVKYLNKFFTVKSIVINKLKHNKKISYLHRIFVISSFYYHVPMKIKILDPNVCMIYQPVKEKNPLLLILQWNRRITPFFLSVPKQISWCSDFGVP